MFEQTLTNNNHLMDYYCLVSWDYFSCTYFVKWQSEMLKRGHNNRIVPFQVFSSDYKLYLLHNVNTKFQCIPIIIFLCIILTYQINMTDYRIVVKIFSELADHHQISRMSVSGICSSAVFEV